MAEIIIGVDPGTTVMGFGVIIIDKSKVSLLEMGVLHLSKYKNHALRLQHIFEKVSALVRLHQPIAVALEAPFFGKNVQSMLKLGRAQGVAIAAAMSQGSATIEYAPRKIKQAVTGNGNASKEQVWKMLQQLLKFEESPQYLDATDAVAVALCHYYETENKKKFNLVDNSSGGWAAFIAANPDRVK